MADLQNFIVCYLQYSYRYFISTDSKSLADQFIDEYKSDLDFDRIVEEIEYAQQNV